MERRIGLPVGWGGPTDDELDAYLNEPEPLEPSVVDEFRGTILDPDDPIAAWRKLQEQTEKPEPSASRQFIDSAVGHVFEAPEVVRRNARQLSDWIEGDPTLADVDAAKSGDIGLGGVLGRPARSFVAGGIGGVGEDYGAAKLLNPFDVITSLSPLAAIRGIRPLANSIEALQALGSAFFTGGGIERARRGFVEGDNAALGQGIAETAMGATGIAAGVSGIRPREQARRGNLLHPEGTVFETGLSTARRPPGGPRRPPDLDAEFWSPDGGSPPGGPAGLLPDWFEGDVVSEPTQGVFPPRDIAELPPVPPRQLTRARRFYSRGESTLDADQGADLEAFLGGAEPRFYQGRRGTADVLDEAGRTRVMGPTADMRGGVDYFDPETNRIVQQQGPYGAIFDESNEAVVFPPEVAAERGIYPDPSIEPPIERLFGMPLVGADEPGPAAWRGTGAQRPPALARQPVPNRTEQSGFNELAEFMGEGAPAPRQQADLVGPMFKPQPSQPIAPPQREASVTPGAQPQPVATSVERRARGRGQVDPNTLSPQLRREIGRMVAELEEFGYAPGAFTSTSPEGRRDIFANRPDAQGHYAEATPQTPLAGLIEQIAGVHANRESIARRLRNALETGRADNILDAAQQIAEAKLAGRRRVGDLGLEIPPALIDEAAGNWALREGETIEPGSLEAMLGENEIGWQDVEASGENLPREFVYRWARGEVSDAEMRQALEDANAGELEGFFGDVGRELTRGPKERDLTDNELRTLDVMEDAQTRLYGEGGRPMMPSPDDLRMGRPIEDFLPPGYLDDPANLPDDVGAMLENNASGESGASLEALSRQQGMQARNEQFGVFDRAGNFRPLLGPDSVDYVAKRGETYGILDERGFRILDDQGGRVPDDAGAVFEDMGAAELQPDVYDIGRIDDILDTGEAQPRLPGEVGGVRDLDIATPQEDVPFSLGREANERPFAQRTIDDLLRGDEAPPADIAGARGPDVAGAPGPEWPIARHGIEAPEKVDEIAQSMARVGWQGRPALVIRRGDGPPLAWTATHRLEAARLAGLDYATQVPKVEVDAAALEAKGYNIDQLSTLGKKKRIEALRLAGQEDAANLLDAERQGSPVRQEAAEAGLPAEGIPDNVRDYITKQLKYTPEQVSKMTPAQAAEIGRSRRVNPNWSPAPKADPEVELGRLLESDPDLAAVYERNIGGIPRRQLQRSVAQRRQQVPARDVYRGGLEEEAGLPESLTGLPERTPPAGDVDVEQFLTEAAQPGRQVERPESALTVQERQARGLSPAAKPGRQVSQAAARAQQDVIKQRAKKMGGLLNDPTPENLDEYVRLLGEQVESQAKREFTGGTSIEAPKIDKRSGQYLASGLGGLQKLYEENPQAFWTVMRSLGGAVMGGFIDEEDRLRGAALGAVLGGVAPLAFSRIRTILRTGKLKPPKASQQDIAWFRLLGFPERTVPEVFAAAEPAFRELEALYADPTRSQSANRAAKQLYLSDLSKEMRELAVEARAAGLKRKSWYLNSLANAVGGVPTMGQRKVQEVGSRLLEGMGFSARKAAEPVHASVKDAISTGRNELQAAVTNFERAKREHSAKVAERPRAPQRELERTRIAREAAKDRLDQTMKRAGEGLRDAANTIDAEVGRTDKPGLVNQAVTARTTGRKIANYKSVKQALAAFDRLEGELAQGPLRVREDVVESVVSKHAYRILIGWALDTAAQNLSQPVLTTLFLGQNRLKSLAQGYRYARTPRGRALAEKIELQQLVDVEGAAAADPRSLREIARASGVGQAVKTIVADPSRPLRVTDNYNRRVSYLAALASKGVLDSALASGRVPAAADAFAREVVRKTQGHTGPLGNNPFLRGPVGGSAKLFTKYPTVFIETVVDALNDPKASGQAAVVALLGAVLLAKGSGLDFEDLLVSGGRPLGIDLTRPGSLRPDRLARGTVVGRAAAEVAAHATSLSGGEPVRGHSVVGSDWDSFIGGDLAYLIFGRYPTKVAQKATEFAREGFGEHKGLRPSGEADPHPAAEDIADLLGVRSTRVTENRRRQAEAGAAVQRSRRQREDTGAEARRQATIAVQRGDTDGFMAALQQMSPGQRRAFVRNLGRSRMELLERQLPRAERPAFREQFGDHELEEFLEGR